MIAGIVFFALSCLIAAANMVIGISGYVRKRRGVQKRRQSLIFVLSIVFSIMAYSTAGNTIGFWVFIPAIVDPATLFLIAAPFLLHKMRRQAQNERKGT